MAAPSRPSLRGIYGKAHQYYDQSYLQFSLSNGHNGSRAALAIIRPRRGDRPFNPDGYAVNTVAGHNSLPAGVDFTGNKPIFTLPSQLLSELGNIQNYALKTMSSEGNYRRNGDLKVLRADASLRSVARPSICFGGRYCERSINDFEFDRASPLYAGLASNPAGCLVKWKAFDVPMSDSPAAPAMLRAITLQGLPDWRTIPR